MLFIALATIGSGVKKEVYILGKIEANDYPNGLKALEEDARWAGLSVRKDQDVLWLRSGCGYLSLEQPREVNQPSFTPVKMREAMICGERRHLRRVVAVGSI